MAKELKKKVVAKIAKKAVKKADVKKKKVAKIIKLTNSSSKFKYLPALPRGDMKRRQPDNSKMKKALGKKFFNLNLASAFAANKQAQIAKAKAVFKASRPNFTRIPN